MHRPPRSLIRRGFSLIELLIVVSIISILASIAVPNFLEAQTRSKVARAKNDLRTLMYGVQRYRVDHNDAPFRRNLGAAPGSHPAVPESATRLEQMSVMTTPLAYLSYLPSDIFNVNDAPPNNVLDYYDSTQVSWLINSRKLAGQARLYSPNEVGWMVMSVGPDGYIGPLSDKYLEVETPYALKGTIFLPYDPTNGTVSAGNIYASDDAGMDQAGSKLMERALRR